MDKKNNIQLKFEVDNTKGTNLKKFIKVSLVRTIYLNKYSFSERQYLFKTKEQVKVIGERFIINLNKGEKREYSPILKAKERVDLPCFTGNIISCRYFIKSTLYPDTMSLSKNRPRIIFDVTLTENPNLYQELSTFSEAENINDFMSCPPAEINQNKKNIKEKQEYLEMIDLIGELNLNQNENDEEHLDFADVSPVVYEGI